jgi:hypothetical protein
MHHYTRSRKEMLEELVVLGAQKVTYEFFSARRILIPELPRGMITSENGHKYCYTGDVPAFDLAKLVKQPSVSAGGYYPSGAQTPFRGLRIME